MKSETFIAKTIAVVNGHNPSVFIANFIDYMPNRLDQTIDLQLSKDKQTIANSLDYFDYHYRKYLCGHHKTLARVFFELRKLLEKGIRQEEIISVTDSINTVLLDGEFYEIMPRFQSSRVKIIKQINSKYSIPF